MRLIWTLIIWFDITLIPFSVMYVFLVILTRLSPHFIKLILRNDFNGLIELFHEWNETHNYSTSKSLNFLFITFSLFFEHVSFQFYTLHAVDVVTSQISKVLLWKYNFYSTRYFTAENVTIISICDDKCHTTYTMYHGWNTADTASNPKQLMFKKCIEYQ